MPGDDHTGPLGQGPRTGRAAGRCAGYDRPGYANPVPGGRRRGAGRGSEFGGGCGGHGQHHGHADTESAGRKRGRRGRGWWKVEHHASADNMLALASEHELGVLRTDLQCLEQKVEHLRRRINELDGQADAEGSE
jgi:hypothetical protein